MSKVAPKVLNYITSNADKPMHFDEIADAIGEGGAAVNNALARMLRESQYDNLRRPKRGIYIWDSIPKPKAGPTMFMLKVLKSKDDGSMLVLDEETERVFVLKEVDW